VMLCSYCNSDEHFRKECPAKHRNNAYFGEESGRIHEYNQQQQQPSDQGLCAFTYNSSDINNVLMAEVDTRGILDCRASSDVCGEVWYDNFLKSMTEEDRKTVKSYTGEKSFRFGVGDPMKSLKMVEILVYLAGLRCTLMVDVVKSHVPLLISTKTMKSMKFEFLSFERGTVQVFGKSYS
jgi:hypothetical protein